MNFRFSIINYYYYDQRWESLLLFLLLFFTTFMLCNSPLGEGINLDDSAVAQCGSAKMSTEEQELVTQYHHSFDDELVDLDLIMDLLDNICSSAGDGEPQHSSGILSRELFTDEKKIDLWQPVAQWTSQSQICRKVDDDVQNMSFYLLLFRCCPNFSSWIRWDSGNQGPHPV